MGGSSNQTIGYRYSMGILMGICRGPIDSLLEIEVGGREAWKYTSLDPIDGPTAGKTEPGYFPITAGNLFGGDDGEGGISGDAWLLTGTPDQVLPARVEPVLGSLVDAPQYRGVTTVFYDGLICTLNPYPKPWKFKVRRVFAGWQGAVWHAGKAAVDILFDEVIEGLTWQRMIRAMNPAHILYQVLTDKSWGRGLSANRLDVESFRKAADVLHEEQFGMCIRWTRTSSLKTFVQTILDHIGGVLRQDKVTGLYKLILLRRDYNISALPVYSPENGILEVREASAGATFGAVNEVIVKYHDPVKNEQAQVKANNIAAIQMMNATATITREYPGVPTAELALRLAQRDLRAESTSLRRVVAVFSRSAWRMQPGDVFIFEDPSRFIGRTVMRIATVEESGNTRGDLIITSVQDVFALAQTSFGGAQPVPPPPVPPGPPPLPSVFAAPPPPAVAPDPPVAPQFGLEMPYVSVSRLLSPGDFAVWPDNSGMAAMHMARPTPTALSVVVDVLSDMPVSRSAASDNFTPYFLISNDVDYTQSAAIPYYHVQDLELVQVGELAMIGQELVRITAIDSLLRRISIARGVGDTRPHQHPAGSALWVIQDGGATDRRARSAGMDVVLSGRPRNSFGPSDAAAVVSIPMLQRFNRPYAPGNVRHRVGAGSSVGWYEPAILDRDSGDLQISWAHRDRVLQADQLIAHSEGNIGPEPGTTYHVQVQNTSGTVLQTYDLAGSATTFNYSHVQAGVDLAASGLGFTDGVLVLLSRRNGLDSWQNYRIPISVGPLDRYLAASDGSALQDADGSYLLGAE